MLVQGRKEAKARGERYTSPADVPSDGSDELIILDKPKAKAIAKGKGKVLRTDPDEEEESEGAWTVEDEEEMDGFIDDDDKNENDHDVISNLLPGTSVIATSESCAHSLAPRTIPNGSLSKSRISLQSHLPIPHSPHHSRSFVRPRTEETVLPRKL